MDITNRKKERLKTTTNKIKDDCQFTKFNKTKSYDKHNKLKIKNNAPPKRAKIRNVISYKNIDSKEEQNTKQHLKNPSINIFSLSSPRKNKNKTKTVREKFNNINNSKIFRNNSLKNEKGEKKVMFTKYNNTLSFGNNDINTNKLKKIVVNHTISFLTDFELDILDYNNALRLDKRTFFQYYWSILKRGNLLLFAIMPNNDYNLRTFKISLFLISFSLYFTINAFFFTDDSMHKLYVENGKYNIVNQIPQMIYSLIITTTINAGLKFISLSGRNILLIKQQETIEMALIKSREVEKCIKLKFILFYFIKFIFFIFFWYFISCFCAVYSNTQKILIHDTLFSFLTSMIYPFGYYLLSSTLRIIALRSNKNKKCLYNLSLFLS